MMISALFRDYAFLTSAYVLEPVDVEFRKSGVYTTGRSVLPRELAVPMKKLADARTCQLPSTPHVLDVFVRSWPLPVHGICKCLRAAELGTQRRHRRYHV